MKIAFTSCSNAHQQLGNQPIWGIIHGQKPDLLLLLGDNVYIGEQPFVKANLDARYTEQLNEIHFNTLISEVPFLAIWDNHDFGTPANVYGVDVPDQQHREARESFDFHLKSRSLKPDTEFVYCTHIMGDAKFYMLDVRSYQEAPGNRATTLGADQEKWLLDELAASTSKYNIICSGTTFSMSERSWTTYNRWSGKFLKAVNKVSRPLFLGGNMHSNGFKAHWSFSLFKFRYLYEVISSSVGRNGGDGLPDNKYGLIDINEKTGLVDIALYSQRPRNNIHRQIKISNWRVQ